MPKTIKQLKEVTPKYSKNAVMGSEDLSQNSALQNMVQLYNSLREYKDTDAESAKLRNTLSIIIQGIGKDQTEEAEALLQNSLQQQLADAKRRLDGEDGAQWIQDEKKRAHVQELIQRVGAGLGMDRNVIGFTDQQAAEAAAMEERGRKLLVDQEKLRQKDAEEKNLKASLNQAQRVQQQQVRQQAQQPAQPEEPQTNILNYIDAANSELKKLPRKGIAQGGVVTNEHLKVYAKIFAARLAGDVEPNNKAGLNRNINTRDLDVRYQELVKSESFQKFLVKTGPEKLYKLAMKGHGGALESEYRDHVLHSEKIGRDVPDRYMPTALDRCEVLKSRMGDYDFAERTPPGEQRKVYMELLATRMAVNSTRGSKNSLKRTLNSKTLNDSYQQLADAKVADALTRLQNEKTRLSDGSVYDVGKEVVYDSARAGHGGELEDLVRRELRNMSRSRDYDYALPKLSSRYQPTIEQRKGDIRSTLLRNGSKLAPEQKKRLIAEYVLLGDRKRNLTGEAVPIPDPDKLREETEKLVKNPLLDDTAGLEQKINENDMIGLREPFQRQAARMLPMEGLKDLPDSFQPSVFQRRDGLKEILSGQAQPAPGNNGIPPKVEALMELHAMNSSFRKGLDEIPQELGEWPAGLITMKADKKAETISEKKNDKNISELIHDNMEDYREWYKAPDSKLKAWMDDNADMLAENTLQKGATGLSEAIRGFEKLNPMPISIVEKRRQKEVNQDLAIYKENREARAGDRQERTEQVTHLKEIAARKMVLAHAKAEYEKTGDEEKYRQALSEDSLKNCCKKIGKDMFFNGMVDQMLNNKPYDLVTLDELKPLEQLVEAGGNALAERFAQFKNGPKVEEANEGLQAQQNRDLQNGGQQIDQNQLNQNGNGIGMAPQAGF